MANRHLFLGIIAILITTSPSTLSGKTNKTNHPLVTPYAGSSIYSKDVTQFDEHRVFMGWKKDSKEFKVQVLEGKITKILYKNPPERSILELYRNYKGALQQEGVELLFECDQGKKECIDGHVGNQLRQQFGIRAIKNRSGRYVLAKLNQEKQIVYLALAVGNQSTDVHVIEMKKMETGKVALNLAALTEGLDRQGFVIVDGIYFDTDKTELKPESKPAIDEVVKLLEERPDLKLYVVGHTDMQGELAYNINLSSGRAEAVVRTLVNKHGISPDRLLSKGVGPLAPVASNNQEDGRALNRRVVLVER
ncbi:MAG: OmpA family protein [Desulfosarcinaceae bacterium]|nr:OmpA family protein [Desulfosarcinaceae bacterium]